MQDSIYIFFIKYIYFWFLTKTTIQNRYYSQIQKNLLTTTKQNKKKSIRLTLIKQIKLNREITPNTEI